MAKPSTELQLKKRMDILLGTRQMMREVGPDNLNVRQLAAHCNVSVPTIYNRFKDKNELLMAAMDDLFHSHLKQITFPDSQSALDRIVYFMDEACEMILDNAESSKWLFKMNPSTPSRSSFLIARSFYQQQMEFMQKNGEIIDWLPATYLGERLYFRIRSTSLEWALGHTGDKGLKHLRHCELAFFLMGISSKPLKKRLELMLKKAAPLAK